MKKYKIRKNNNKKTEINWIITISIISFVISFLLSLVAELIIPVSHIFINILLVFIFIFLGIIFDIIGVAVTTANEKTFHSMAAQKVKGAKSAIKSINKKDKMSSFCNDVIGDICGVISGSCGLTIAIKISEALDVNVLLVTLLITSIISALTIGGKAIGKSFAVNNSDKILFSFSKIITIFQK